jgi:hypothetical protein
MKLKIELDSLSVGLDIITRLAPPTSGNITFTSNGKRVHAVSSADLSRCVVLIPCDVEGEGEFAIPLQALRDATRGRNSIEMEYKNSMLTVKGGRYSAELVTVDVIPLDELEKEDGKELKLSVDQSSWLKSALKTVALKPTTMFSTWIPAAVKMTNKSAFVCCFDAQHMSWASTRKVTGDFECVLPLETLTAIVELFHKQPFIIRQTATRVEILTKYAQVYLNAPTLDGIYTIEDVQGAIKDASKAESTAFHCQKKQLLSFLDNAKAVMGKDRVEIEVEGTDKGIKMTINTGQGKVSTVIKGKGKGEFKIDHAYLVEALSKAGEEVSMAVVHKDFMTMKFDQCSVMIALNQ